MKTAAIILTLIVLISGCSMHHRSVPRVWNPLSKSTSHNPTPNQSKQEREQVVTLEIKEPTVLWSTSFPDSGSLQTASYWDAKPESNSSPLSLLTLVADSMTGDSTESLPQKTLSTENKVIFGAVLAVNLATVFLPEISAAMQILLLFPVFIALGFLGGHFFKEMALNTFPSNRQRSGGGTRLVQARKIRNTGLKLWLGSLLFLLLTLASLNTFTLGFIFSVISVSLFYVGMILLLISLVLYLI
ncbi:MAG: hypothetical protein H6608_09420 [Flavobacteriales bacterium]|nr:hypothetical protein [Bacteroidota bacterium]MCB9241340.1 hypothetical protein [Flavobacteriales bacterium]